MIPLKNPTSTRKGHPCPRNSRPGRFAPSTMPRFRVAAMVLSLLYMSPPFTAADLVEKKYKIAKAGEGIGHGELLGEQLGHEDHGNRWDVDRDNIRLSNAVPEIRFKEEWTETAHMDAMGKTSEDEASAGIGVNSNKGGVVGGSNIQSNDNNKNDEGEKDGSDAVNGVNFLSPVQDQTSVGVSSFNFVDELKRIENVSSRLRGTTTGDGSSVAVKSSMFSEVLDVAKSYLGKIHVIQKNYHSEDKTAATSAFKSIISDKASFVEANRYVTKITGKDFLKSNDIDIASDEDSFSLDDIPNSQLEEIAQAQVQTYDHIAEISQDLVNILEGIEPSIFPSPMKEPSTEKSSNHGQPFTFESGSQSAFHQPSGQTDPHHDIYSSASLKSILQNQKASMSRRSSMPKPKLSQFTSFLTDDMVIQKHEARVNAIGVDVCKPACPVDDRACNCQNLFSCVSDMTKYDLAVLLAGGYLNTDAKSNSFGNFTVSGDNLNLFDADDGVSNKLKRVKNLVKANQPSDANACLAVLEEFHSACNPYESTCAITNQQTFQVTTDQVCDAVNTGKKLLFEVIGDEYDGFTDASVNAKCQPLSYDTCEAFVSEFDRLYEARNTNDYPLSNPMRKDPSKVLYTIAGSDVFNHAQFPIGYVFLQDDRGKISRTFTESSAIKNQLFSIVNELDGMALAVSSTCASKQIIELQEHDRSEVRQQFYLTDNGNLFSQHCQNLVVTAATLECVTKKIDLVLETPFVANSLQSQRQMWRFHRDGSIRSTACPNAVISGTKNSLEDKTEPVPFSLVNPGSKLSIGLKDDNCDNGNRIVLVETDPNDPGQQFIFGSDDKEIYSVKCPGKLLDAELGYQSRCYEGHYISLRESNGGSNQQWELTSSGTIVGVGKCQGMALRIDDGPSDKASASVGTHIELNNIGGNVEWWEVFNAVTSDLGSLNELHGPFSFVNPSSDMAITVRGNNCEDGDLEIQEYDVHSDYQQFYLGNDGVLFSASCLGKVVSFDGSCGPETSVRLLGRRNVAADHWNFNKGRIVSASCEGEDFIIGLMGGLNIRENQVTSGTRLELRTGDGNPNWDEDWDEKSNDVIISTDADVAGHKWRTEFFEPNYDYALLPGFPGDNSDGCYNSAEDPQTATDAMHSCDKSMALLVGSQSSVGTLRATAKLVGTNPEHMPGVCCMDNAANSQYFGYDYDPKVEGMSCQNKGPWHLGISEEACGNAGGHWTRSPCIHLKACIDGRPKNGTDAYSSAFEKHVRRFNITDAGDESQCRTARDAIGFDRDYPYDTEVCEAFNSEMCDPLYTEVDIMSEGLDSDPTWTHIRYKSPNYPEDKDLEFEPLPDIQDFLVPNDIGTSTDQLVGLRESSLSLQWVHFTVERAQSINDFYFETACEILGGAAFVGDALKAICETARVAAMSVLFALEFAAAVAHETVTTIYEEAQLGDGEQIDIYTYSKALFDNSKEFTQWNTEALGVINKNMVSQHIQMRDQLQVRHKQMTDCITCTTVRAINVLGCNMAEFNGGDKCDESSVPGCGDTSCPQTIAPFNIQWPVGQPNLIEKLDAIQTALESTNSTRIGAHNDIAAGTEAKDMEVLKVQLEAMFEGKIDAIEGKLMAIERKMGAFEGKIDAIEGNMQLLEKIEGKMNLIEGKMDAFEGKMGAIEVVMSQLLEKL